MSWRSGQSVCVTRGGVRIFTAVEALGSPREKSAGMSASAATASPPCSRSPWGLPGCSTAAGAARGLALRRITAPSICRTTSPTRSLGHPAVLRLRRRAPDQRRRRAVNRRESFLHWRSQKSPGVEPGLLGSGCGGCTITSFDVENRLRETQVLAWWMFPSCSASAHAHHSPLRSISGQMVHPQPTPRRNRHSI